MSYGTTPEGFARKPLSVLLAEIEAKAVEVFGPGVIQSPQSPLGQLNGLYASLASTLWEVAEDTYQSYDPDQAEGVRLEQLARVRLLERIDGELDTSFRAAVTNAGRARIDLADIRRAVAGLEGVTYAQVFENKTSATNKEGLPPHSVAVAVLGATDIEVATAIRPYIVPGINAWGNARVDATVDGYCRTLSFVRPKLVPLGLQLTVITRPDRLGCPPPSAGAIALAAANGLTGANRPANGQDITLHLVRTAVAQTYPNVEVVSATSTLDPDGALTALPRPISFLEIADVLPTKITVAAP